MEFVKNHRIALSVGSLTLAAIALVIVGVWYTDYSNKQTMTCTVNDKDRTTKGGDSSSSEARLYTDECGVLTVNDRLFSGSNDSADLYNRIKVGKTYELTTVGRRIPLLSTFPNAIEVREVG